MTWFRHVRPALVSLVAALLLGPMLGPALADDSASSASASSPGRTTWQPVKDGTVAWYVILLMSVASVALMVDLAFTVRSDRLLPRTLADELEARLKARRIDDALRLCQEPASDSFLARVVLAALRVRNQASEPAIAALELAAQQAGQVEAERLYRRTDILGAICTIAPLIGLLGSAQSLLVAFHTIAASGASATAADLAAAASRALVITILGLVVAIPTLTALAYFRARLDNLLAQAATRIEQILQLPGRTK
ncbi:MAG TPA: MotA/TolQ/ExbB proton channel family protein [Isosphaeraceae bacterium]|jgi:biopolymer transport protein ExbB/TolQ|nr:MotA/TolQ/ExbB proton channel family protein [Isosphaeraceae bacterium]